MSFRYIYCMRKTIRTIDAVKNIFDRLVTCYGPQGWWPLISKAGKPGFDERGYHKADYSYPQTRAEEFEIAIGAVLTQNTAWKNVEIALPRLSSNKLFSPKRLLAFSPEDLKELIRPCGYYNQKAKKLASLARFFDSLSKTKHHDSIAREDLLGIWGVGEETCDSILLYAFKKPIFVVDAYTKRIFARLGLIPENASYGNVQRFFMEHLAPDVTLYSEYHALIVVHAKASCNKDPECGGCVIDDICIHQGITKI
jgi:endonuclease III related protein